MLLLNKNLLKNRYLQPQGYECNMLNTDNLSTFVNKSFSINGSSKIPKHDTQALCDFAGVSTSSVLLAGDSEIKLSISFRRS